MEAFAKFIGTLMGYAIGHTLKIAGPELKVFLVGVIRDALSDSAEVGKPNSDLSDAWDAGLRNAARNPEPGQPGGKPGGQ